LVVLFKSKGGVINNMVIPISIVYQKEKGSNSYIMFNSFFLCGLNYILEYSQGFLLRRIHCNLRNQKVKFADSCYVASWVNNKKYEDNEIFTIKKEV